MIIIVNGKVLKSYIKYSVNECPNTLYARDCEVHGSK